MARILIVDDEPMVGRCMERILERAGHRVDRVVRGEEGIQSAARIQYDVAFVDYQMPGMLGLEVLRELRRRSPGCARILVTGKLDLSLAIHAVNQGEVFRVFEKPFDPVDLLHAVDEVLEDRRNGGRLNRSEDEAEARMLSECLDGPYLRLAVQPIARASDGEVLAYEALLRSTHPRFKTPIDVIEAAERQGRLTRLQEVVVSLATGWMEELPVGTSLFLNLHPSELGDPAGMLARLRPLRRWATSIVLEITERSSLDQIPRWRDSVDAVIGLGFRIAVDDLGAGYSSLSVLASVRPAFIKLDMSLVREVDLDDRKRRLVELMCRFADATDSLAIAEGVETAAEASTLRACGAHLLQGYYIARPSFEIPQEIRAAS